MSNEREWARLAHKRPLLTLAVIAALGLLRLGCLATLLAGGAWIVVAVLRATGAL